MEADTAQDVTNSDMAATHRPNDWMQCLDLLPSRPLTVVEDKYTQLFLTDISGVPNHDQYAFIAPNGVCVIGLAPSHPLIAAHRLGTSGHRSSPGSRAQTDDITSTAQITMESATANATCTGGVVTSSRVTGIPLDQLQQITLVGGRQKGHDAVKQSGKKQHVGPQAQPRTVMCILESKCGHDRFHICAGVSGKLLEMNERLRDDTQLLYNRPCREGYIAVLYPTDSQMKQMRQTLMPLQQYLALRGLTPEDLL